MVTKIGRFVTLVVLVLLASCKQVEYIPIESVVKDTIYRESVKIDSIILTDSVFLHIHTIDDTVYSEKVKVLYRDRYKYERDTIYLHRTDTIRVPVPIERKATLWEQTKENLGNLIRLAGLIVFGGFLVWFISLLRKQK